MDLLIVGGGINGAGIARDAAGRGLSVMLVEREDLAQHTSSASTKLIHGGLRYLEHGELRLVRESLVERERLLAIAPHIIWPLHFVLPQSGSPRPAWMIRLGLFLYDNIGGRKRLPATRTIRLERDAVGAGLRVQGAAFVYSDCWVEDSRLVVLNALDAAEHGATVMTRTPFVGAVREGALWRATIGAGAAERTVRARAIVNAGGPWVADVLGRAGGGAGRGVRLVKGSHIVVPRLYAGEHAFLLQNADRRVVFAVPYEGAFTLVGTTDEAWTGAPGAARIDEGETAYLLDTIARYFDRPVGAADIVWSYAGIRPLYDNKAGSASKVTRDYVLDLDTDGGHAPLLSIYGGKITTYRRLAEHALTKLAPHLPPMRAPWTASRPLPGGDIAGGDFAAFVETLRAARPGLPGALLRRLARAYGTRADAVLGDARATDDLDADLGGGLHAAEVDYLARCEWAVSAEDVLWRRSKLGLHVPPGTAERVEAWLTWRALAA